MSQDAETAAQNGHSEPPFPFLGQEENLNTAKKFAQHVHMNSENAVAWFQYLVGMEAYKQHLKTLLEKWREHDEQQKHALDTLQTENEELSLKLTRAQMKADLLQEIGGQKTKKKSAKHPEPPDFSGKREEFDNFLTHMKLKLKSNADHYPSEESKLFYVIGKLKDVALKQVTPHIHDGTVDFNEVEDLYNFLYQAFGDPDKQANARRRLHALRQKNQEFAVFIAEFNRIAPDTGLDDKSKIFALEQGLSTELQALMIHHEEPEDLNEYIKLLQKLDSRMRVAAAASSARKSAYKPYANSYLGGRAAYTPRSSASSSVSAPVSRVSSPTPSVSPSESASNLGPMPMDLSNVRKGPVPPEEKERRKRLGLCGYCGNAGHSSMTCPAFKCYNCGELGHGGSNCTKPKKQRIHELSLGSEVSSESEKE